MQYGLWMDRENNGKIVIGEWVFNQKTPENLRQVFVGTLEETAKAKDILEGAGILRPNDLYEGAMAQEQYGIGSWCAWVWDLETTEEETALHMQAHPVPFSLQTLLQACNVAMHLGENQTWSDYQG